MSMSSVVRSKVSYFDLKAVCKTTGNMVSMCKFIGNEVHVSHRTVNLVV
jgi:hypothetical protein